MKFSLAKSKLPSLKNALLAILSAILLIFAFPDFDCWILAWFSLVPLFFAVEREKQSVIKSFVLGWTFGSTFFFGSCWWLTFAPTTYGGLPAIVSYALLFGATAIVGFFPAIFCAIFSLFLRRFGSYAILSAPFLWTATEFLRFNLTGNNWNAIGYSQAFNSGILKFASVGGIYLAGFWTIASGLWLFLIFYSMLYFYGHFFIKFFSNLLKIRKNISTEVITIEEPLIFRNKKSLIIGFLGLVILSTTFNYLLPSHASFEDSKKIAAEIIAVQPNVPMSSLKYGEREILRQRHVELAENALQKLNSQLITGNRPPTTIIFPESPMNFEYEGDRELKAFLRDFAVKNNASVLFNSAQPNTGGTNFYNSAVMINAKGEKVGQYDKIHLVPFGETVPLPDALAQFVPTMVGNFETGDKYNLLPFGDDVKGGVMICFESHFPSLSREYVRQGADVLIEMTNDGYLGKTPVLRQHLANAVFRAVETNRPLLRVTNVGITAYINERGEVLDAAESYTSDARVWTISKSDGGQTFYVRYGDWFAWLCSIVSLALLFWSFRKRKILTASEQQ